MLVRSLRRNWRDRGRLHQRANGKRIVQAIWTSLLVSLFSGCANTIDTITSERFRDRPFHYMFHSDDPMYVLRNVQVADDRAKAMLLIKEPKVSGGNAAEQDELIEILAKAATKETHSYCRLNAIKALGRFEDPRAGGILLAAYHNASKEASPDGGQDKGLIQATLRRRITSLNASTFSPDQVLTIQCAALEALAKKQSPEGLDLLCEIASKPVKEEVKATDTEMMLKGTVGQDQADMRLAAIRGLGNYKGNGRAAQTLYHIMTTERTSVAVKNRAHIGLMNVTDKDYSPDSPEWAKIVKADASAAAKPSVPKSPASSGLPMPKSPALKSPTVSPLVPASPTPPRPFPITEPSIVPPGGVVPAPIPVPAGQVPVSPPANSPGIYPPGTNPPGRLPQNPAPSASQAGQARYDQPFSAPAPGPIPAVPSPVRPPGNPAPLPPANPERMDVVLPPN